MDFSFFTPLLPCSTSSLDLYIRTHTHTHTSALPSFREMFSSHVGSAGVKIDVDLFCDILTKAGFGEEEACNMFEDIRGGEEICLQDFQYWWKRDSVSHHSALKMSSGQLRLRLLPPILNHIRPPLLMSRTSQNVN